MPPKAPKPPRRFQVPETITTIPASLPGREAEFATIVNHVLDHIQGRESTILFVSGACGSGKTSTISRAEAYLRTLPSNEKTLKDRKALESDKDIKQLSAPVNIQWIYINCTGLTLVALMDAIWGAVCSHAEFASNLLKFVKDMFLALGATEGGGHSMAKSVRMTDNSKRKPTRSNDGLNVGATAFFKKYQVSIAGKGKEKVEPFFAFAFDEAEFADQSSHLLLSAFTSCAVAFSSQMSLILISNAKSLPFLPLSVNGNRSVTELVFTSYSVESLKEAVRAHFATKFILESSLPTSKLRNKVANVATKTLDDVLSTAALDFAVKKAVEAHGADLRKAIALCANAISEANEQQKKSVTSSKQIGVKRAREENESADLGKPTKPQPKATLQTLIGAVTDAQSSLDQIQTLPPYMRQLLKCFVECVKKHSSYSFLPRRLQEELYKKTEELRIPSISSVRVIEGLEELRSLGFVTTAATTKSQKEYTLCWSLAELEPKLALIPGFI